LESLQEDNTHKRAVQGLTRSLTKDLDKGRSNGRLVHPGEKATPTAEHSGTSGQEIPMRKGIIRGKSQRRFQTRKKVASEVGEKKPEKNVPSQNFGKRAQPASPLGG